VAGGAKEPPVTADTRELVVGRKEFARTRGDGGPVPMADDSTCG
jgi:hypothetical protein